VAERVVAVVWRWRAERAAAEWAVAERVVAAWAELAYGAEAAATSEAASAGAQTEHAASSTKPATKRAHGGRLSRALAGRAIERDWRLPEARPKPGFCGI